MTECLLRLVVRTSGFHPDNGGSIPPGDVSGTVYRFRFFYIQHMTDITSRCSRDVCGQLRQEIAEAGGAEVFFGGMVDDRGMVVSVYPAARGHESAVPLQTEALYEADVLIHNHPSGHLMPSQADLAVAAAAAERAQGFYIIDNAAEQVYAVVEPVMPKPCAPLDGAGAAAYISAGGALAAQSAGFEERPSQIALLEHICRVFNEDSIGVFEAGTGVGKSYAYLIPAVLWALNNKERIVISTGTINLQQQLAEKDIPAAVRILGREAAYVLVKGRNNYVCLRRFHDAEAEPDLFSGDAEELSRIGEWLQETGTGSRSDLAFNPSESLWGRICSESDACMGMRCPYHDTCFVMRVRKEASSANILIVNHHLLFADIESRMNGIGYEDTAVLPPYRHIIFDEAHGIEHAATSFFSDRLSRFRLVQQLNNLHRVKRGSISGLLLKISGLTDRQDALEDAIAQAAVVRERIVSLETAALEPLRDRHTLRLSVATESLFSHVLLRCTALKAALTDLCGYIHDAIDGVAEEQKSEQSVWEVKTVLRRLETCSSFCASFAAWDEHAETVCWLEKRLLPHQAGVQPGRQACRQPVQNGGTSAYYPVFVQTPLDIAQKMNSGVFEPMRSVVCTSATIRTGDSFDYWMRRTGISLCEPERICTGSFDSPFSYEKNMFFAVPSDVPDVSGAAFRTYAASGIADLIRAAGGRTLALFTSYDMMRSICRQVRQELRSAGFAILMQGDDDRSRLLQAFRSDETSVLFATDSFWEGIDVPGASLSQVIIAKLPFSVPDDPVFEARCEAIERRGGNPFLELSVPEAVIKFRQGVGRLIRRGDDRGAVVVLDKRLINRPYGRLFANSVPQKQIYCAPLAQIKASVERFLSL